MMGALVQLRDSRLHVRVVACLRPARWRRRAAGGGGCSGDLAGAPSAAMQIGGKAMRLA